MKKILVVMAISLLAGSTYAQRIDAIKADEINKWTTSADTVYIINFWATWCMPCVQELPEFNTLYQRYQGKPIKMLMVSLDFKDDFPGKLQMFAQRKRMLPHIAWLSDTDPNEFIPSIEKSWQGSIPATLIIRPGKLRKFIEGQTSAGEIGKIVDAVMN